jgi:outer membrane protein TolC
MAGVLNPTIALAREAVQESLARQLQADVLLVPTLHAGASFDLHRGNLESARGVIESVNRQSFYAGAGASAVGAGTVTVPGLWIDTPLAEAFVEPHAARLRVTAREFDAAGTRNNVLLDVATRYLALAGAQARLQALLDSHGELAEVVRVTTHYAETGQGAPADMERARSETLLLHSTAERAEEDVAVASADLARLLDTDPSERLRVADAVVPQIDLVDPSLDLGQLVEIAVRNRPEIRARVTDVAVNATELRKERLRPLLPAVMLGLSAGEFGGGSDLADSRFGHTSGRVDFDLVATWSLQNLALGNLAVQRRQRALVFEAEAERVRVIDQVRREVAEARALAAARRREVDLARQRIELATQAYRQDLNRTRNLEGRPIIVLNSLRLLSAARQALVAALVRYDQAEFQLFVALGQPPNLALPGAHPPPVLPER